MIRVFLGFKAIRKHTAWKWFNIDQNLKWVVHASQPIHKVNDFKIPIHIILILHCAQWKLRWKEAFTVSALVLVRHISVTACINEVKCKINFNISRFQKKWQRKSENNLAVPSWHYGWRYCSWWWLCYYCYICSVSYILLNFVWIYENVNILLRVHARKSETSNNN